MIFEGKTILVTGGTGSMGKTFVRRVLSGELGTPKKVIVFSRDEAKQHDMRMSYLNKRVATDEVIYRNFMSVLEFRIGDVRNYPDVCSAIKDVDIVVNAAALKQVPACEYFPTQAILTNCMGASNIVQAIRENGYEVDTVIGISTDKACKPVNVMGMTKSIQERIFIVANVLNPNTRFICVRYGNVLASRGSVIPLFIDQIINGGPLTVTVSEMTRFLLSLDQAVDTVFEALKNAEPGETYIPVVPSATVMNIAKALIGNRPIDIETIGIRPGEKMHEILVSDEEANHSSKRGDYYAILSMLPELSNNKNKAGNMLPKEYSSADSVLDFKGTIELLKKHRLMVEDVELSNSGELLR
ncbi:MAG: polysaccharide biosynthesis protein [Deltaproteobacteria bacterium]|nr:polysaccharide biosynthesis protein [Deltaproteobacteria bacterium]